MGQLPLPEITAIASLKKRQQPAMSTLWMPITSGTGVSWKLTGCDVGKTIYTYSSFWECCPIGSGCTVLAQCNGGTVVDLAGNSQYCLSTGYQYCQTQYLLPSDGAVVSYTFLGCGAYGAPIPTYYLESPTSTTSSTTSTTPIPAPSPPPSNDSSSKTPVGAIAGGVIGGLAVIALIAVGIFFVLRSKKHPNQTTTHISEPIADVKTAPPPSSVPNSPPPGYPNSPANPQNNFYIPTNQHHLGQPGPMADAFGRPLSMHPVGGPMNTGMYSPPTNEMSSIAPPRPGTVSPVALPHTTVGETGTPMMNYPTQNAPEGIMELPGTRFVDNGAQGTAYHPTPQGGPVEIQGNPVHTPYSTG